LKTTPCLGTYLGEQNSTQMPLKRQLISSLRKTMLNRVPQTFAAH
jgi:hypothetical protein